MEFSSPVGFPRNATELSPPKMRHKNALMDGLSEGVDNVDGVDPEKRENGWKSARGPEGKTRPFSREASSLLLRSDFLSLLAVFSLASTALLANIHAFTSILPVLTAEGALMACIHIRPALYLRWRLPFLILLGPLFVVCSLFCYDKGLNNSGGQRMSVPLGAHLLWYSLAVVFPPDTKSVLLSLLSVPWVSHMLDKMDPPITAWESRLAAVSWVLLILVLPHWDPRVPVLTQYLSESAAEAASRSSTVAQPPQFPALTPSPASATSSPPTTGPAANSSQEMPPGEGKRTGPGAGVESVHLNLSAAPAGYQTQGSREQSADEFFDPDTESEGPQVPDPEGRPFIEAFRSGKEEAQLESGRENGEGTEEEEYEPLCHPVQLKGWAVTEDMGPEDLSSSELHCLQMGMLEEQLAERGFGKVFVLPGCLIVLHVGFDFIRSHLFPSGPSPVDSPPERPTSPVSVPYSTRPILVHTPTFHPHGSTDHTTALRRVLSGALRDNATCIGGTAKWEMGASRTSLPQGSRPSPPHEAGSAASPTIALAGGPPFLIPGGPAVDLELAVCGVDPGVLPHRAKPLVFVAGPGLGPGRRLHLPESAGPRWEDGTCTVSVELPELLQGQPLEGCVLYLGLEMVPPADPSKSGPQSQAPQATSPQGTAAGGGSATGSATQAGTGAVECPTAGASTSAPGAAPPAASYSGPRVLGLIAFPLVPYPVCCELLALRAVNQHALAADLACILASRTQLLGIVGDLKLADHTGDSMEVHASICRELGARLLGYVEVKGKLKSLHYFRSWVEHHVLFDALRYHGGVPKPQYDEEYASLQSVLAAAPPAPPLPTSVSLPLLTLTLPEPLESSFWEELRGQKRVPMLLALVLTSILQALISDFSLEQRSGGHPWTLYLYFLAVGGVLTVLTLRARGPSDPLLVRAIMALRLSRFIYVSCVITYLAQRPWPSEPRYSPMLLAVTFAVSLLYHSAFPVPFALQLAWDTATWVFGALYLVLTGAGWSVLLPSLDTLTIGLGASVAISYGLERRQKLRFLKGRGMRIEKRAGWGLPLGGLGKRAGIRASMESGGVGGAAEPVPGLGSVGEAGPRGQDSATAAATQEPAGSPTVAAAGGSGGEAGRGAGDAEGSSRKKWE